MRSEEARVLIIGLGTQGIKRQEILGPRVFYTVDPKVKHANFKDIAQVPLDLFDVAFVCTPDKHKEGLIRYLLDNNKHVLCEKPLILSSDSTFQELEELAREKNVFLYTAYNHRFEPSFIQMKSLINSGTLGTIYGVDLFYGNGTARLVRDSDWRDTGLGVVSDLGSHLIDAVKFWFPSFSSKFELVQAQHFENYSPDYANLLSRHSQPSITLTVTMCSWKNTFRCQVYAENAYVVIDGLVKWGEASINVYRRILPSGIPDTKQTVFPPGDPTWREEHEYFFSVIEQNFLTDLSNDSFIFQQLRDIITSHE